MRRRQIIAFLVLQLALLGAPAPSSAGDARFESAKILRAAKFYRTELYFGLNMPDGRRVSDEDWAGFLEAEVTPRFPAGFTVIAGYGQYRAANGKIVREESRVLVLFYPKKERAAVDSKIEELRAEYKKQFSQESVLRLDFRRPVTVSFE